MHVSLPSNDDHTDNTTVVTAAAATAETKQSISRHRTGVYM